MVAGMGQQAFAQRVGQGVEARVQRIQGRFAVAVGFIGPGRHAQLAFGLGDWHRTVAEQQGGGSLQQGQGPARAAWYWSPEELPKYWSKPPLCTSPLSTLTA